jgi:hypothetical protein
MFQRELQYFKRNCILRLEPPNSTISSVAMIVQIQHTILLQIAFLAVMCQQDANLNLVGGRVHLRRITDSCFSN